MRILPCRSRLPVVLTVITCLALPAPALAAPAALPDWGVKGKSADKPADKPDDAPISKTAELPDWGVAGKSTKPARPGKPKKKPTTASKADPPDAVGEPEPEPDTDTVAEPDPATIIPDPDPVSAPPPAALPAPAKVDVHAAQQQARRGRGELITGAVFSVIGLAGIGVLGAGIHLKRDANDELKTDPGRDEAAMNALRDQQKQGDTLLAAGAVAGVIGMALGIALIAAGARDLKTSRAAPLARLRLAPSFGGLVLSGRF